MISMYHSEFWGNFLDVEGSAVKKTLTEIVNGMELGNQADARLQGKLEEEGYFAQQDLVLEWLKFESPNIKLIISNNLEIRNCVFFGDVEIHLEDGSCSPSIHSSIFAGKLKFTLARAEGSNLEISNCFVGSVNIIDCSFRYVNIVDCIAREFIAQEVRCKNFTVENNFFDQVSIANFESSEIIFPSGQIHCFDGVDTRCGNTILTLDASVPKRYLKHIAGKKSKSNTAAIAISETYEFLIKNTGLTSDTTTRAHLRYLHIMSRMTSCWSKSVVWALGGLLKPYRVALASIFTIVAFSSIYYFSFLGDLMVGNQVATDFMDCLYFSGIAFTTIGFGDIVPKGAARGLAVAEGLIGVILSSALVASFIRKYTE